MNANVRMLLVVDVTEVFRSFIVNFFFRQEFSQIHSIAWISVRVL